MLSHTEPTSQEERGRVIPFGTTPEQIDLLTPITQAMTSAGLEESFVASAQELARTDQGVFDLMDLWTSAPESERDDIVAAIQASIADYAVAIDPGA